MWLASTKDERDMVHLSAYTLTFVCRYYWVVAPYLFKSTWLGPYLILCILFNRWNLFDLGASPIYWLARNGNFFKSKKEKVKSFWIWWTMSGENVFGFFNYLWVMTGALWWSMVQCKFVIEPGNLDPTFLLQTWRFYV